AVGGPYGSLRLPVRYRPALAVFFDIDCGDVHFPLQRPLLLIYVIGVSPLAARQFKGSKTQRKRLFIARKPYPDIGNILEIIDIPDLANPVLQREAHLVPAVVLIGTLDLVDNKIVAGSHLNFVYTGGIPVDFVLE